MYIFSTGKTFTRFAILLSIVIGFTLVSAESANAQRPGGYDYSYERSSRGLSPQQIAREIGYRDGRRDGADARRERDDYNPQNSGDWQKATNGYEGRYRSKSTYRMAYRSAYERGYRDGYGTDRYGRIRNW